MTNEHAILDGANVAAIVAEFLASHEEPGDADWKRLIEEHPDMAAALVDFAILYRGSCRMREPGEDASLDGAAFQSTISQAINLVHAVHAQEFTALESKLEAVRGPGMRRFASEAGLGPYPHLVSGVLAGTIEAPRRLLTYLVKTFEVSALTLMEHFRRSRESAAVPAFKATSGKPSVAREPISWGVAVRSLGLPEEEAQQLLRWEEIGE